MFHLVRNCKTICERRIFYIPTSSLWEFQLIQMFATLDTVSHFKHSNMYESIFVISFFVSLMTNNAENCAHVLFCHLCIFFEEVLFRFIAKFFSGLFVVLLLNFKSSLYILNTSPLSDMWFGNIFYKFSFIILLKY